jgi:hypothetical protein
MNGANLPQPGDIGLTQIQGDVGKWIHVAQFLNGDVRFKELFRREKHVQHAFVVVDTDGSPIPGEVITVVEAQPGGAILAPLSKYSGRSVVYLRCPDEFRDEVAYQATTLIGTPYSFLDYLSLAARRLHIPAPHLRAYVASSAHMICSQLCDEAAKRGGWHLFDDGRWSGDVTPGDLYGLYREGAAERERNEQWR